MTVVFVTVLVHFQCIWCIIAEHNKLHVSMCNMFIASRLLL
jgi:hypothetical protein